MKVCFFGLGSIGKRHLKNYIDISQKKNIKSNIHAYRSSNSELDAEIKKYINREIFTVDELDDDYDIIFITNPTHLHYDVIKLMSNKTKNMFIEKPVFDKIYYNIEELNLSNTSVYYVAAPLRYSKVIRYLKENIEKENVYSVRAICSSYLPNWRPNSDYRQIYSAKKREGGGVSIDCIHEWDYLTYLFGFPNEVLNLQGKFSNLEIDSEDLSIYIARYNDKLIELHLDYFGRKSKREIEIYTDSGCIIGDLINNKIIFDNDKENIEFGDIDRNYMYEEEMEYFINLITDDKYNENDVEHAYKVLKLIKKSE